jgi:hypothetical protein
MLADSARPGGRWAFRHLGSAPVDDAHRALRDEIFRRLEATKDDPKVTNTDGSNYWGPRITKAVRDREGDGPALVGYVQSVLRKTGESEGWNALLEADRLDLSFEEMVLNADEPVRGLFTDDDRRLAAQILDEQGIALQQKSAERESEAAAREAEAVAYDRKIVADVRARREAAGHTWSSEIEGEMLGRLAARRRPGSST